MAKLRLNMTMSLDGYVAGPNQSLENPLGEGGMALHDWAFATRFQADRDLMVMEGMRTVPIDPSLMGSRVGAKAGFDLTWPVGAASKLEMRVPEPPRYAGKRFPSIEAALADGPKFFEDLMSAVGSRDGREIVRALEALRAKATLDRDNDGRYFIKA